MNVVDRRNGESAGWRGGVDPRARWEVSPAGEELQSWLPDEWPIASRWFRWFLALAPPMPALWIAVATALDSPNSVNPGLEFHPATVGFAWAALATFPVSVYLSRHVPVPGRYPDCPRCLRRRETLLALLEGRDRCRCGNPLRSLIERDVVRSSRRPWRAL